MPRKIAEPPVRRDELDARAYLAAIVESSEDAILSKDLNGIITSCNAAAERIFGYTADELIGQSVLTLIPPERHEEEAVILARVRAGERVNHFETVRLRKDGRRIDLSLTVSAVRDASGAIIGASKVARDITERKRAIAALKAQEAWFRITLNSIADAVIAADAEGVVTYINAAAASLTGWSAAEANGQPLDAIFPVRDERSGLAAQNSAHLVLKTGEAATMGGFALLVGRDGAERPIADIAAPIRDTESRMLGVVLAFRDVGPQRAEAASRQQAGAERERLLAAERSARSEAERASRIKDEFIAMVSHELRTPLNAILGWTQLMARSPGDLALIERGLDVVARNTRVQAQLVSDLLDISRIVEGKLTLDRRRCDVGTVVIDALDTVAGEAAERGLTLRRPVVPAPLVVTGDPARLQQIVWNLLSNAIKFTPSPGEIVVSLHGAGGRIEIAVADTGGGMRADVLPYIFDRFHQADRSITRRFGGLGLGLAIVKHLVELHGGQVRAESPGEGLGSTFTVTLPESPDQGVLTAGPLPSATADAAAAVALDGVCVMVVEDEPDTLQFLKRLLESHGAVVVAAATAIEAREAFDREPVAVLISDIGLPGLDGYDLIRQIRALTPDGRRVPAIALTAYARAEDRTRALRAGYQAHVTKPVDGAELMALVASLLAFTSATDRIGR